MRFLKLPAALRWAWVNCFIMLAMMTGYRLLLLALFSSDTTPQFTIFLGGIARDGGVISVIAFLYLLLTFSSALHPYKSRKGMLFSFGYFSFFAFLLIIIFAMDLVSIKTFGQRLSGTKFLSLFEGSPKSKTFFGTFPIVPTIVGAALLLWNWWIILDWLHSRLGMYSRADEKIVRYLWQGLSAFIFSLLILFSVKNTTGLELRELSVGRSIETALKVNPVLTLFLK